MHDYVGVHKDSRDWNVLTEANATKLLKNVNALMGEAKTDGVEFPLNPHTATQVAGETYGGFRPQDCPIGAAHSNHKTGKAVDIYDPHGEIDSWCLDNLEILAIYDIWLEHPSATVHWSHWQCVSPASGKRVFHP